MLFWSIEKNGMWPILFLRLIWTFKFEQTNNNIHKKEDIAFIFLPSRYRIILKSFPSLCEYLSSSGYKKVMSKHSLQKYSENDTFSIPEFNKKRKKQVAESIKTVIVIWCNDYLIFFIVNYSYFHRHFLPFWNLYP